jgi:cysteine sulfinate desulfinase/cysteine desulfurase-like protein
VSGGHQEKGLRAGTENVMAIVGLGKAAELAIDHIPQMDSIRELRDKLENGIKELISDAKLNGPREQRLPNTCNLTLPGIRGESLVLALDQKGTAISSGSACSAGVPEPSHALMAMGLPEEEAHCAVRFTLGLDNTIDEIDHTVLYINQVIRERKDTIRFVSCR